MRSTLCALLLLAVTTPALCQFRGAPVPAPACGPGLAPTPAPDVSVASSTPGPLGNCQLAPGDGSTCSQNPCSYCAGLAAGVYADPSNNCTTFFNCYPTGAECLKCYSSPGAAGTAQCPTTCPAATPISPAYCEPVANTTPPASPATPATPATPVSTGSCSVLPGDGSTCSQDPCTACAGKAAGVYPDSGSGGATYFDCFNTGAECLKCYGSYGASSQCPGATPASPVPTATPASPAPTTPATPASTPGCTQQPGDGSTCAQAPCSFCAGKSAGVYADVGSGCGATYYSCYPTGAECLKCYSSGFTTQCPASSSCRS